MSTSGGDREVLETLRLSAFAFAPEPEGFGPLLDSLEGAQLVLIGEASHGTHEFYQARAALTKALIERYGFNFVAVEADWPDAYRVNRWVRHASSDPDAQAALGDFARFPRWMWRNTEVVSFVEWLRERNAPLDARARAGFYGLDLYSLHTSIAAVLDYLKTVDPAAAARARYRYGCFEDFAEDTQAYGYAAAFGMSKSCEDDVVAQLLDIRRRAAEYATRDGQIAADEYFVAEQNARLVKNAEEYYRTMFAGHVESWNRRDTHMMETLNALLTHVGRTAGDARGVVWAHNSHLGDARATQAADEGEVNLGQLAREAHGDDARLIGFTTHTGSVTAAREWDDPAQWKRINPSREGSYERLFHDTKLPAFLLMLDRPEVREALKEPRLERAIGVIYRPDSERISHYFTARIVDQFDAVLHIDETRALEPLEAWSKDESDVPDTFPFAL